MQMTQQRTVTEHGCLWFAGCAGRVKQHRKRFGIPRRTHRLGCNVASSSSPSAVRAIWCTPSTSAGWATAVKSTRAPQSSIIERSSVAVDSGLIGTAT